MNKLFVQRPDSSQHHPQLLEKQGCLASRVQLRGSDLDGFQSLYVLPFVEYRLDLRVLRSES